MDKKEISYDELVVMFLHDFTGVNDIYLDEVSVYLKDIAKMMIDRGWVKE